MIFFFVQVLKELWGGEQKRKKKDVKKDIKQSSSRTWKLLTRRGKEIARLYEMEAEYKHRV